MCVGEGGREEDVSIDVGVGVGVVIEIIYTYSPIIVSAQFFSF